MSTYYGPEQGSAVYQWYRRLQTRLGNAVLLWMGRRYARLPARAARRLGPGLGTLMRYLSPRHYRIVLTNLKLAFGEEKDDRELRRIAAACYRHLGKCLMEFIRLPAMTPEEVKQISGYEGREYLDEALSRGRGVILLTAHLGNWEMVGARIAADGYPLNVIARAQRDDRLTEYIRDTRRLAGMRVLHREESVRASLRALRKNELVGILLDQNAGDEGIFVDFFGHLASTAPGAAAFALRTGAAVVPTFGRRNPDDTHTIIFQEVPPLIRSGDLKQDIAANTAHYTKLIEAQIRRQPEQWFWLHKRWKSRPPEERGR